MIIDPGAFTESEKNNVRRIVEDNEIKIKYIVNTHGHLDHILGNKWAKDFFKVPILMHRSDEFLIDNAPQQARFFGLDFPAPPPIDEYITEDTVINLNGTELKFINTPGHSPGSVCIIDDKNKNVFCGDLIFKNSIGRTDLQGGDLKILLDSVKNKLFKHTKDDYILHPGHMEITNVKDEREYNPFLVSGK
ncbi:MAG: MBL fold metallo-hydrolase [Ignavibacteria bacterium]|nr:MBL fold metallo-hydrolase [Ignavibacteria bacterium]